MKAALETTPVVSSDSKLFRPLFLRSPVSFIGDTAITGVEFSINSLVGSELENQQAIPTGQKEVISSGLALRSIGYRSVCADPSIPFDSKNGKVINKGGRVDEGNDILLNIFLIKLIRFIDDLSVWKQMVLRVHCALYLSLSIPIYVLYVLIKIFSEKN